MQETFSSQYMRRMCDSPKIFFSLNTSVVTISMWRLKTDYRSFLTFGLLATVPHKVIGWIDDFAVNWERPWLPLIAWPPWFGSLLLRNLSTKIYYEVKEYKRIVDKLQKKGTISFDVFFFSQKGKTKQAFCDPFLLYEWQFKLKCTAHLIQQ